MAFTLSGSQTLVSGNETGLSYRTWLGSNPTAGKQLTANTVEALFQLKIQNGAIFDTSDIALVINARVEGQANATTDTGIWRCKGGVVIVQGGANQYAENWAIQDWDNVQVYIQKTGGNQSFIGSNARPIPASVKNTKFIVKNGNVDVHLQSTGGTGTISNVLFRNDGTNVGMIAMRDTDSSDIELYRIEPFGWSGAPTTFHKNLKLYNSSADELNFKHRKANGGCVFYNSINSFNGNRMTVIRYTSSVSAGDNARSVLVGAYSPKIIDISKNPMSGVEVAIFKTSDGSLEASGETGADGKIAIVNNSLNVREMSYNNTFIIGGTNYTRKIYDAGIKYIKQSITPTTTGGNVVSVDQGTFKIVQRRKDLQEIIVTQSFLLDYTGEVVAFTDPYYTTNQSANLADITFTTSGANITAMTINANMTIDRMHDITKAYLEANLQITNPFSESGTIKNCGGVNITGIERITAGTKLTSLQSSGTITANGAFSIEVIGNVSQATPTNLSNVQISGTLTYNTNTDTTITITDTNINTVENLGTGIVTINKVNSTIDNYTDAEINFIDSMISVIGADTITFHPTENDRDLSINASGSFSGSYAFKFGSTINGSLMSGTLYLRCVAGAIPFHINKEIVLGDNLVDLGTTAQLASLSAKIDLAAKESTLLQTKVDIITEVNANETKIDDVKTVVDALENYDDTILIGKVDVIDGIVDAIILDTNELQAQVDANEAKIDLIETKAQADARQALLIAEHDATQSTLAGLNNLSATQVWAHTTRALTDKLGFELTPAERTAISVAVEQAILNESDGQAILNAIVGAIGNSNVDEIALVAAIRTDLERASGMLDGLPTLSEIEASSILAKTSDVSSSESDILAQITKVRKSIIPPII